MTPATPQFLLRDTAGGRGDSLWSRPVTVGPSQEEEQGPYCCPLLDPSAAHPTLQAAMAGANDYWNRKALSGELQDRH